MYGRETNQKPIMTDIYIILFPMDAANRRISGEESEGEWMDGISLDLEDKGKHTPRLTGVWQNREFCILLRPLSRRAGVGASIRGDHSS